MYLIKKINSKFKTTRILYISYTVLLTLTHLLYKNSFSKREQKKNNENLLVRRRVHKRWPCKCRHCKGIGVV